MMYTFCYWILGCGFLSCVFATIEIKELRVPQSIPLDENITEAEFDCIYEAVNETGLEVKWFFNGAVHQIYQWVPGYSLPGSPMGLLKKRVDLNYSVTNDSDTEYRGFKINNISQELSGNYTCKISSDLTEASDTKQMIIYSPADTGLDIILINNDGLVVCNAYGISPMPEVDFYMIAENGTEIDINEGIDATEPDNDGLYNITATHDFSEYNHTLKGPTKFICNMSIPGTSYYLTKELVHLADVHVVVQEEEEEIPELNVTDVPLNERDEILMEIVNTTPRGSSAVHLTALSYTVLLAVLSLLWI